MPRGDCQILIPHRFFGLSAFRVLFIRIYWLDKQGKPVHFDNLDGLPHFNRRSVINFNRSPEFSVDLHISLWRHPLPGNSTLTDHRTGPAGSLPVIGSPDKWKQQHVFDNPKTDDTPEKPYRKHDPVLDNNQDQNNSRQFRDIQQNISEIDRPWYFFQVQIQLKNNPDNDRNEI
jgi:hypothetical protein